VAGCSRPGVWNGLGSGMVPEGAVGAGSVPRGAVDGVSGCGTLPRAEGGGTVPCPSVDGAGTVLLGAGTEGACGGGPNGSSGVGMDGCACSAAAPREKHKVTAKSKAVASDPRMYVKRTGRRVVSAMIKSGEGIRSARRPCPARWGIENQPSPTTLPSVPMPARDLARHDFSIIRGSDLRVGRLAIGTIFCRYRRYDWNRVANVAWTEWIPFYDASGAWFGRDSRPAAPERRSDRDWPRRR
jgi:hypothetical protein